MKIEFIIPTYNRPAHLSAILWSLRADFPDWTAHVVGRLPALPEHWTTRQSHVRQMNRASASPDLPTRHNDFGHTPRNVGLNDQPPKTSCA